ncbi:MAG: hypothetical protein HY064_02455 [Bacteroidetes bacterium]|nr:hypothetical protein [Bacteroidota bacterium]
MRKFGTYTNYEGLECELALMRNGEFHLIYRAVECRFNNFILEHPGVFVLPIEKSKITNSFFLNTKAIYKNFNFEVDRFQNGKYRLSTADENAYKTLHLNMVDRGWYDIEVPREEIQKMWEERKPSGYGFPFPEGMKEVEEIEF